MGACAASAAVLAAAWAVERDLPSSFRPESPGLPPDPLVNGLPLEFKENAPFAPLPPALPCGDCPGTDPGGLRPAGGRRLLSFASGRPDALASGWYEGGSAAILESRLAKAGWSPMDFGGGLSLWARDGETLLVDASGPGRPGTSLLYWRLP